MKKLQSSARGSTPRREDRRILLLGIWVNKLLWCLSTLASQLFLFKKKKVFEKIQMLNYYFF